MPSRNRRGMGLSELGAGITANAAGTTRSGPTKSCRLRITQWRKGNACHRRHLFRKGLLLGWGLPTTGALVERLLDRGSDDDVAEAEAAIERLGPRRPKSLWRYVRSAYYDYGRCWRGRAVRTSPTRTSGVGITQWPANMVTRAT
jgi:hypothetical protein